jgi:hypothetical protein
LATVPAERILIPVLHKCVAITLQKINLQK